MGLKKATRLWLEHIARFGVLKGTRIVQLKSRRSSSLSTIDLPENNGPFQLRSGTSDMAIFDEIFYSKFIPRSASYDTVIDCGANIGCTVRYWTMLNPSCKVVAVEPDSENFGILLKNTTGMPNVHCVQAGVWPVEGSLHLDTEGFGHSGIQTRADASGDTPAVTIPGLMKRYGMEHISLLKIDIEGSELELFSSGDLGWIANVDTIAIELHDHMRPGCGDAFFKAIAPYSWTYEIYGYTLVCSKMDHA